MAVILEILENLSFLVLLMAVYLYISYRYLAGFKASKIISGIVFGLIGLLCMLTAENLAPGVFYDGRSVVLTIAGVFAGPLPAAMAAAVFLVYRLAIGGAGAIVGGLVILEALFCSLLYHHLAEHGKITIDIKSLAALGAIVHILMFLIQFLLPDRI